MISQRLYLTIENVTKIQLKMLPLSQAINQSLCSNQKGDLKNACSGNKSSDHLTLLSGRFINAQDC